MAYSFTINDRQVTAEEGDMPLLWFLRDEMDLVGTKFGCGIGSCGACTVLIDGEPTRSCVMPVEAVDGMAVTTIEGLARNGELHPVQQAWIEEDVPQCGYCQTGQIMATIGLLKYTPDPTETEVREQLNNFCRCGTYARLMKGVKRAAELTKAAGEAGEKA